MDVGVWLRSLGLGRYEVAFSDNSIDADILPDLTDGDLAQLGVNLGDRKRLLKAIASWAQRSQQRSQQVLHHNRRPRNLPSAVRSQSCFAISSARRA